VGGRYWVLTKCPDGRGKGQVCNTSKLRFWTLSWGKNQRDQVRAAPSRGTKRFYRAISGTGRNTYFFCRRSGRGKQTGVFYAGEKKCLLEN